MAALCCQRDINFDGGVLHEALTYLLPHISGKTIKCKYAPSSTAFTDFESKGKCCESASYYRDLWTTFQSSKQETKNLYRIKIKSGVAISKTKRRD